MAATIGGVLGTAAGFAVYKLIGFDNLLLMIVLIIGCTGVALFLAQKIASK